MRVRGRLLLATLAAAAVLSACAHHTGAPSGTQGASGPTGAGPEGSAAVTVVRAAGDVLHPFVMIKVGNTRPVRVALDTGSTGLQLFALPYHRRAGSGVTCSQQPDIVSYGDPPRISYTGQICSATITIGGATTVEKVPFGLLTTVSCPSTNPSCNRGQLRHNVATGQYGVLGIALGSPRGLVNPLLAMAGGSGARYSLALTSSGGTLGVDVPAAPGGATFHLTSLGSGPLGYPTFEKSPQACLVVSGHQLACMPTLFDSGQPWPTVYGNVAGLPLSGARVVTGTSLGFAPPGSSTIATSVQAGAGGESPVTWSPAASPHANAGVESFLGKVFTFDPGAATITIAAQS